MPNAILISLLFSIPVPDSIITQFRMFDVQPDDYLNDLTSRKALYYRGKQETRLDTVFCTVKHKGERDYDIRARKGNYKIKKSYLELWGEANIETQSGFTIQSEWFEWLIAKKRLRTNREVTIVSDDLKVKSLGGDFNMRADHAYLKKDVSLVQGGLEMRSEKGDLSFPKNRAVFEGNVEGRNEGGQWSSEAAVLIFQKSKRPKQQKTEMKIMQLKGDVEFQALTKDGMTIYSDTMDVNQKARKGKDAKMIATGHVRAKKNNPTLDMTSESLSVLETREGNEDISLHGNTVIKTKDKVAHSQNALIQVSTGKITLSRRAWVESKGDKIQGEKIIFYIDDDRILVKEATGVLQNQE